MKLKLHHSLKNQMPAAKATMFFATLIATMLCFAVTAFADDDPLGG